MARTAIPVTSLVGNAATADVAGTAIDQANGQVITVPRGCSPEELVLVVTHTASGAKNVTINAGDFEGKGALVTSFAAGNVTPVVKYIVPGSARFLQADGTIELDYESGATGTVKALWLQRKV